MSESAERRPCPVCDGDGLRLRTRPAASAEVMHLFGTYMAGPALGVWSLHMLKCDPCDGNGWVSP